MAAVKDKRNSYKEEKIKKKKEEGGKETKRHQHTLSLSSYKSLNA